MDFVGKNVYITGGSSGIGLELARQFARRGANLLLIARNEEKLKRAVEEVRGNCINDSQRVEFISMDVGNYQQVSERMTEAVERFGAPHILIANAGIGTGNSVMREMSYDTFDRIVRVNLYGVWNVIKVLLPGIIERRGHIVIISSAAGLFGMHDYTAYAATKGALNLFAESLRYEMKPLGVRVTVVCPPEVETPFLEDEARTLSPVGRFIKNLGGMQKVEFTSEKILKGIERNRFCVIPGIRTKFFYLVHRITGGRSTRFVIDTLIKYAYKKTYEEE